MGNLKPGGISEPITHAAHVRAEGSHVICHLDRFRMNNGNTVGEAVFVCDTATYPAPQDDDPLPGSMVVQIAAEADQVYFQGPAPGNLANPGIPGVRPTPTIIIPGNPTPPSTPIPPDPGSGTNGWWRTLRTIGTFGKGASILGGIELGLFGGINPGIQTIQRDWQYYSSDPDPEIRGLAEQYSRAYTGDLPPEQQQALEEEFRQQLRAIQNSRTQTEAEIETHPQSEREREAAAEEDTALAPGYSGGNVRVTEPSGRRGCRVGTYRQLTTGPDKCPPGSQAHHIVADYTLRYGSRGEGQQHLKRSPGLPDFWNGPSICLYGHAKEEDTEHWLAHQVDEAVRNLGERNIPRDTAPLGVVKILYQDAAAKAKPQCKIEINDIMMRGFAGTRDEQLVRTRMTRPLPTEGTDTHHVLKNGWSQQQFDDWVTAGRPR